MPAPSPGEEGVPSELVPDGGEASYADLSPFVRLLKNRGRVKILDTLLRRPASEFTSRELCELTDISQSTISRNKDVLIDLDLVETTEQHGVTYYSLNRESELTSLLGQFHAELMSHYPDIIESTDPVDHEIQQWARRIAQRVNQGRRAVHQEGIQTTEVLQRAPV